MRVVRARVPQQAEDCSRACEQRAESARNLAIRRHSGVWHLLRRTLVDLVVAMCALALVYVTACSHSSSEDTPFMAKSDAAMARMLAAMRIKPTNDVDRDFVAMMVPHHQGAIDMAYEELSYGRSEPLRGLAQEIIATQEEQIAVMRRALDEPLTPSVRSFHQPAAAG
jgi:hypothetical protein